MAIDIKKNIAKVPADTDLIVGIPRSGMLSAVILSENTNIPCTSLDCFMDGKTHSTASTDRKIFSGKAVRNVLVIDDSICTGKSVDAIRAQISDLGLDKKFNITYCAVYGCSWDTPSVDFCMTVCPTPRMFQWNYLNIWYLEKSCWDIDGLLCLDPTSDQNDDGPNYEEFLRTARPLMIPKFEIMALVTSRLEKYRSQTEEWLAKHGVKYKKLYMLNVATAEERRRLGLHAPFKAKIFKSMHGAEFFYESERQQAIEISKLSGKPCFCTTTDELFFGGEITTHTAKRKKPIRRIIAVLIPFPKLRRRFRG